MSLIPMSMPADMLLEVIKIYESRLFAVELDYNCLSDRIEPGMAKEELTYKLGILEVRERTINILKTAITKFEIELILL